MIDFFQKTNPSNVLIEQSRTIKKWVKSFLNLDDSVIIMVSELNCTELACPPIETIIVLLWEDGTKQQFKIHKPIITLTYSDIELTCQLNTES